MGAYSQWLRALAFAMTIWALAPAYAQGPPRGLTPEETTAAAHQRVEGHAIVDISAIWPTLNIEVCWEGSASGFVAERRLVQQAVRNHIEANSGYRFGDTLWGDCDPDERPRIRISVEDSNPRSEVGFQGARGFGRARPTRMWLNFTYAVWSPVCSAAQQKDRCNEFIAVHEFLHALGALHEQLHPDVARDDPACFARYRDHNRHDVQGHQPVALTAYSPTSALNYCYNGHWDHGVRLSDQDKVSLQRMTMLSRERMAGQR